MIFKPYNCDFGVKYKGVQYDFDMVDSATLENPESTKLIRGADSKNKKGLVYKEGVKDPKRFTVVLVGIDVSMFNLLTEIHAKVESERCEFYCVDRTDGSSVIAKQAVLSQQPLQLGIDESPESMNISLTFESFDVEVVHKS